MTREEIKSIIQEVTCRECGAIYGYDEHQEMINQATTKIMGGIDRVKNNRELLIAFAEWTQRKVSYSDCVQIKDVDKFIKENND
jgi:hypothetical protein